MFDKLTLDIKYAEAKHAQEDLRESSERLMKCAKLLSSSKMALTSDNIEGSLGFANAAIQSVVDDITRSAKKLADIADALNRGINDIREEQEKLAARF